MVFPVVMYGCESWTLKKAERRRIPACELRHLGLSSAHQGTVDGADACFAMGSLSHTGASAEPTWGQGTKWLSDDEDKRTVPEPLRDAPGLLDARARQAEVCDIERTFTFLRRQISIDAGNVCTEVEV